MNAEAIEPSTVGKLCDVIDEHPKTLRLVLPRDQHRVAESIDAHDRELVEQANAVIFVSDDDDGLDQLLATINDAGLRYALLAAPAHPSQVLLCVRVGQVF